MKNLIFDSHYICHMSKHSMKGLTFDEMDTGVIFGFIKQIIANVERFKTNSISFAWDAKLIKRREMYPEYKSSRREEKTEEQIRLDKIAYPQFGTIRRYVLPTLGLVNSFIQSYYEADDIIASIIKSNPGIDHIIVSSDNDLYQLLSPNVSMFNPMTKKEYKLGDFLEEWQLDPTAWPTVKAMAGCKSDNVEGIRGVGEITAAKYLRNALPGHAKANGLIRQNKAIVDRNYPLVKIPLEGVNRYPLAENQYKKGEFLKICDYYGFRSLYDKVDWWEVCFNGKRC